MLMQIVHGVAGVTSGKWFSAVPCSISVLGTSRPGEPDCEGIFKLGLDLTQTWQTALLIFEVCSRKRLILASARKGQTIKSYKRLPEAISAPFFSLISNLLDVEVVGQSSLLALVSAPNMISSSLEQIIVNISIRSSSSSSQ